MEVVVPLEGEASSSSQSQSSISDSGYSCLLPAELSWLDRRSFPRKMANFLEMSSRNFVIQGDGGTAAQPFANRRTLSVHHKKQGLKTTIAHESRLEKPIFFVHAIQHSELARFIRGRAR